MTTTTAADEDETMRLLAQELVALDDARSPVRLTLSLAPADAFMLVAGLQLLTRHPSLSHLQLESFLRSAHQLADLLTEAARDRFGRGSVAETILAQGFDPDRDVPIQ